MDKSGSCRRYYIAKIYTIEYFYKNKCCNPETRIDSASTLFEQNRWLKTHFKNAGRMHVISPVFACGLVAVVLMCDRAKPMHIKKELVSFKTHETLHKLSKS